MLFITSTALLCFGLLSKLIFAQGVDLNQPFSLPVEILINPQTNKVFVLNSGSNEITIFDGKEKKAIANIPTGGKGSIRSISMLMGEAGNLGVLNRGSDNITFFPSLGSKENFDQSSIDQILEQRRFFDGIGLAPRAFDEDPILKKLYILNDLDETLRVRDAQTKKVTLIKMGKGPRAIEVNQATHKVYVVNSGDNTVFIMGGSTDKLVNVLSFGSALFDLKISNDNKIFVSSPGDETLYVIDGESDKLIANIKNGGKGAGRIAINNITKKLYLSNGLDASISVIDIQNFVFLKRIPLPQGSFPDQLTVDEDANLVFVSSTIINKISIIDGGKDEIISNLETGVNPGKPVINHQTKEVYIPNPKSNSITIISKTADGKFQAETIPEQKEIISTGKDFSYPWKLAINESDNEIYVLNNSGKDLIILDSKTYKIKDKISVGLYPQAILFVPELNKIFVSNTGNDYILAYNLKNKSQKTIAIGKRPIDLVFNSQTQKLYILNFDSQDVSVVDVEKENLLTNISLGGILGGMTLNSKDNKIYLASLFNNEVIIIDGNTDQVQTKIKVGLKPNRVLYNEKFNRIYVINSASNDLTVIDGTTNQIIKTLKLNNPLASLASDTEKNRIFGANPNGNTINVIDSENLEIISPDIRVAGNPSRIIFDSPRSRLFTISPRDFLTIVNLESSECPKFLNVIEAAIVLAGVPKGTMTDAVFNSQADKLFISLGEANALAVIDIKNNEPKLEAVVSNKGVTWAAPLPQGEMTWSQKLLEFLKSNIIYILAGIILLIIIIYFVVRRIKTSPESIS